MAGKKRKSRKDSSRAVKVRDLEVKNDAAPKGGGGTKNVSYNPYVTVDYIGRK